MHSHMCRECEYDIECAGRENANGCTVWNGSNDGCYNCVEICWNGRRSETCDSEYRCGECYPGKVPERPIIEHDWEVEVGELRAAERAYIYGE